MSKCLIVAELRELEKKVSLGEISYSKMVELLNEKSRADAIKFARFIRNNGWRRNEYNQDDNLWMRGYRKASTEELYNEYQLHNL